MKERSAKSILGTSKWTKVSLWTLGSILLVMTVLGNLTPSNFNNLFGSWNRVSGSHNTNFGNCNKIQGHGNLNIGADLQVQGSGNRVVGANHCVQGNGVDMFGTNADPKFYNYDLGGFPW